MTAYGGYAILGLLALHVAGALCHHLIKHHDVLRWMLPSLSLSRQRIGIALPGSRR
jgi:cytochrome b561